MSLFWITSDTILLENLGQAELRVTANALVLWRKGKQVTFQICCVEINTCIIRTFGSHQTRNWKLVPVLYNIFLDYEGLA